MTDRELMRQAVVALDLAMLHGEYPQDAGIFREISNAANALSARLAQPEPDYRDVVIKGDLWRIEFLPDHAASVVLVRANYEAQSEPKLVADKY